MKHVVFFLLLLFACRSITAQRTYADSLEHQISHSNPQERIELLNDLMRELIRISPNRALQTGRQLKHLADSLNSDLGRAHYYRLMGALSYVNGNFLYSSEFVYRAITLYTQLSDSIGVANCFTTLANSYARQKLYSRALDYQQRALDMYKEEGNERRIGVAFSNLTFLYNRLGKYDSALLINNKSIRINQETNNNAALINDYKNLGFTFYYQKKYKRAIENFEKALSINERFREEGNVESGVETLIGMGKTFRETGNKQKALSSFMAASQVAAKSGYLTWLKEALLEMSLLYKMDGDYNEAHRSLENFVAIADSVEQRQLHELIELGDVYLTALQESRQNELLVQEKELKDQLISQQRLGIFYGVGAMLLLLLLLYFLKRSNTRRRNINNMLNDRVAEVASQKVELEKLNQTKDKFFSIVAHDLRSPMNTLKSFASLIHMHVDSMSKDEIVKMGRQIEESTETTIKMLDNLITWAMLQMQQYELNPEVFRINEIVLQEENVYKRAAELKGITFINEVPDALVVYADKNQIMFIIRNLVNNAIKFTNTGGIIKLTAKEGGEGQVQLSVYDNGVGISVEALQNIFQLKNKKNTQGTSGEKGTGLGLTLCKEFAEQNKGRISVESESGKGTVFHLHLPAHSIESN